MPTAHAKTFWAIDPHEKMIKFELHSSTPRDAALKMATRDEDMIYIVEPDFGKFHVFRGERRPLSETEQNDFTRRRNIVCKPSVSKLGYRNMRKPVKRGDIDEIAGCFLSITS